MHSTVILLATPQNSVRNYTLEHLDLGVASRPRGRTRSPCPTRGSQPKSLLAKPQNTHEVQVAASSSSALVPSRPSCILVHGTVMAMMASRMITPAATPGMLCTYPRLGLRKQLHTPPQ